MRSHADRCDTTDPLGYVGHIGHVGRAARAGLLALSLALLVVGPSAARPITAGNTATAATAATAPVPGAITTADMAAPAAPAAAEPAPAALAAADVDAAVHRLRADPALSGTDTTRRLRLRDRDQPDSPPPARAEWLRALAEWLSDAGRVAVWLVGALVVAVVAVAARRWARERAEAVALPAPAAPLLVGGHDIRPESLPEAIGPAVMAQWHAGASRAALALLYRGALSRLVHRHGLPVVAASTEGDVLRLARAQLPAEPAAYVGRLVGCWQRAVYGAALPDAAEVRALCEGFDPNLGWVDAPQATTPPAPPAAPGGLSATGARA